MACNSLASRAMTQPRQIIKGATYFLTRRVVHRTFLLRPDETMTNLILYSLAVSARRYEIEVHAFCAMSTHLHLVVTDPKGVLPNFLRTFHYLVAMGTKLLRRWKGAVWDNARTSVVRLLTREAIVEKIAYTLANPVAARAVSQAHQWPGAKNLVNDIGNKKFLFAKRPLIYFNAKSAKWPASEQLQVFVPPMIEDAIQFREDIARNISNEEKKAHSTKKKHRHKKHRAKIISPLNRSTTRESRYLCNPTFAVGQAHPETFNAAYQAMRSFRQSYRNALAQWRAGNREVEFPVGTWWMREFHKAKMRKDSGNDVEQQLRSSTPLN